MVGDLHLKRQWLPTAAVVLLFSCPTTAAGEPQSIAAQPGGSASAEESTGGDGYQQLKTSFWLERLASEHFAERAAAEKALLHMGLAAHDDLRRGLKSADPEVRRRCRLILADCLEADYRARLAGFEAALEAGEFDNLSRFRLPTWDRFRGIFGVSKKSCQVFLNMQRAEAGLFATAEADGDALGDAIRMRFQQSHQPYYWQGATRRKQISFETIAAILYLSSDPAAELPPEVAASPYWSSLVGQASFREALQKGEHQESAKKLLGLWIVGPTSLNTLHQKLQMAIQYEAEEGVALAVSALENEQTQSSFRGYAAMALGALGGKPYATRLAALLEDDTECSRRVRAVNGERFTDVIQVRDIALAWLIFHTGQKHADYGWDSPTSTFQQIEQGNRGSSLSFYNFGFADEKDREAALQKWKQWLEGNELPPAPERELQPVKFTGFVNAVVMQAQQMVDDAELAHLPGLELADRLHVQALLRAAESIERGRNVDASSALGEILADPLDYAFQADRGIPLFRRLKPEAERLLSQLNAEGREEYRLQFAARAQHALDEALVGGSIDDLRAIGRQYFHTRAGADATYVAAVRLRLRGRFLEAALLYSRLKTLAWDADRFEPALSLQLAVCYRASGFHAEARELAEEVKARWSERLLEQRDDVATSAADIRSAEAFAFMERELREAQTSRSPGDWLLYRGDYRRNAAGMSGGAYLAGRPLAEAVSAPAPGAAKVMEVIESMSAAYRGRRQTALPTLHPLVVGETVVFRSGAALEAYDASSGQRRWSAPADDVLRDIVRNPQNGLLSGDEDDRDALARGLRRRFWDDHAFGRLSSDGSRVFSVESHTLGVEGDMQRLIVREDGRRQLDAGPLRGHNTLAAYDLSSGKLLWEVGGPEPTASASGDESDDARANQPQKQSPAADPLAGLYFLGPPLPLCDTLYAIASRQSATLLLELDPADGSLRDELLLETRVVQPNPYAQVNSPLWMLDRPEHRCGASPAYADGVLICRLSLNRFAAIDLASRSVLWRYDPDDSGNESGGNAWMNLQQQIIDQANRNPIDHWADATPAIAGDRVVLTPGDMDEILCLRLRDGQLLWRADRGDGIYLAGVFGGKVVVVGRSSVRAYDLTTGAPAWEGSASELPPGATPSGFGYFHGGDYYLPLSTAEVARLNLDSGEFTARSLSVGAAAPGNLVATAGHVISQSPQGVWVFPTLRQRRSELTAALESAPEDAALRQALGEVHLYEGELPEAIAQLKTTLQLDPENRRAAELLAVASLEGLRTDYETFRSAATDLAHATDDPARRFRFLQEQALAREKAGHRLAALEAWLAAIALDFESDQLIYAAAARAVRRDRYLAARLESLYDTLSATERREAGALMTIALRKLAPRDRLRYFGWHAATEGDRLQLAAELISGPRDNWLEAEWLLRQVIQAHLRQNPAAGEGAARGELGQAVALLAELLRQAGQRDQAARCYQYLNTELADVVCRDGQTGSQLYAMLPDDAAERNVAVSTDYWPVGKAEQGGDSTVRGATYRYLTPIESAAGPLAVQSFVEIDTTGRTLAGVDRFGGRPWTVKLPDHSSGWSYNGSIFSHSTGSGRGHLLLVWLGNRVAAVDLLNRGEEPLWLADTYPAKAPAPGMRRLMPMRLQAQRNFAAGFDGGHAPLALLDDCVCFQQERNLLAVHPLTGEVIWRIDDLAEHSSLFSLGDALLVVSAGGDTAVAGEQAVLYDSSDGREIARRTLPSATEQIGWAAGRLVYWRHGEAGRELVAYDPLSDRESIRRVYGDDAHASLIGGGELAVLDRQAGLELWQLPEGRLSLRAECPLPADLQHFMVIPHAESYTLLTCVSGFEHSPFAASQSMYGFVEVHGPAFGFERGSGRKLWETTIADQRMRMHQPTELPVVVLRNQQYRREGNVNRTQYANLVLDRRSGEELYRNDNATNSHFLYQTHVDLEKGVVEVRSSREHVTLYFKGKPDDKADAKEESPRATPADLPE